GRGYWSAFQIIQFLRALSERKVQTNDVLYFDDFWTPPIESITYATDQMGIQVRMYAMLHAQSIDIFEFTYPMREWMRHFEQGIGKLLKGIFVTSSELKDLCTHNGIGTSSTVHLTGLPYQSEEVKEHFPEVLPKKKRQVIFTSRWDEEKDPGFFLDVIDYIVTEYQFPPHFLVTTSAEVVRSNDTRLRNQLDSAVERLTGYLTIKTGLSKQEYYQNLLESKTQFNCANQDWIAWTLLEATTCGCRPVYPHFRSFPECLPQECLYIKRNVKSAASMIMRHIDEAPRNWTKIYSRFDHSFKRCLSIMGYHAGNNTPLY
ncbi:hypothetical protein KA005_21045, partial [bacterium]|nr:hypothetical protein [bacterium]